MNARAYCTPSARTAPTRRGRRRWAGITLSNRYGIGRHFVGDRGRATGPRTARPVAPGGAGPTPARALELAAQPLDPRHLAAQLQQRGGGRLEAVGLVLRGGGRRRGGQ